MPDLCWLAGRILPADDPALPPGEGTAAEGSACYTTARWTGSGIRHEERHVARLARDASRLGLGPIPRDGVRRAFAELGRAAFEGSAGVIRLDACTGAGGALQLVGRTRPLGPEPSAWRAIRVPFPYESAPDFAGAKLAHRPALARARDHTRSRGADEGLLFDARDRLVEGTRTNLVAVGADGIPCAPPAGRGAVAGIALEIAAEALPELVRRDCMRAELGGLRELVALNAVRGAVPIVELDGRPLGTGHPGPVAERLAAALDAAS